MSGIQTPTRATGFSGVRPLGDNTAIREGAEGSLDSPLRLARLLDERLLRERAIGESKGRVDRLCRRCRCPDIVGEDTFRAHASSPPDVAAWMLACSISAP